MEEIGLNEPKTGLNEALAVQMVQSSLQSRLEALERRVDGSQRDAVWAGRIQGISIGIALAGFVAWLVWSLMNMGS